MKAIVREKYGSPDVLELKEVEKPTPKDNEVLVHVHAASVNYIDWQVLTGESFFIRLTTGGIIKPKHKILGDDLAGRVEAVADARARVIINIIFFIGTFSVARAQR